MSWIALPAFICSINLAYAFDNDGLHFSVIYDESVCSSDDICDDFRKELTATKDAIAYLNTDSRHYVYVISSGLYTRHVVRVQDENFAKNLDNCINEFIYSSSYITHSLAMLLATMYRHSETSIRNVIILFLNTNEQRQSDSYVYDSLMTEIAKTKGYAYAIGVGNVNEEVLKKYSVQPQQRNVTYFLSYDSNTIIDILKAEQQKITTKGVETTTTTSASQTSTKITTPPTTTKTQTVEQTTRSHTTSSPNLISSTSSFFQTKSLNRFPKKRTTTTKLITTIPTKNKQNFTFEIESLDREMLMPAGSNSFSDILSRKYRLHRKNLLIVASALLICIMVPYWIICSKGSEEGEEE